jgi:glutamate formiminotransferase
LTTLVDLGSTAAPCDDQVNTKSGQSGAGCQLHCREHPVCGIAMLHGGACDVKCVHLKIWHTRNVVQLPCNISDYSRTNQYTILELLNFVNSSVRVVELALIVP